MKKQTVIALLILLVFIIFVSYYLFSSGMTNKLKGQLSELSANTSEVRYTSDLPVITMVFNSSGEKLVNDDVAITINAESNSNITKVEYSYDLNSWKTLKEIFNAKSITAKLTFDKTMDIKVYIRVTNERGYKSYAYQTFVKIDKSKPTIDKAINDRVLKVTASDNVGVAFIQGSNDKVNWDIMSNDDKITINNNENNYKYLRAVDLVGNISEVVGVSD